VCCLVQSDYHHIYLWTVASVCQHYKIPTQCVFLVQSDHHKHAELDSYSASSLKQQSTGRYDDGRFVLDNTLSWILIALAQRSNSPKVDMMIVALYLDCCFSELGL
jgi:hypothetical protein